MKCSEQVTGRFAGIAIITMLLVCLQLVCIYTYSQVSDTTTLPEITLDEAPAYEDDEAETFFLPRTLVQDSVTKRQIPDTSIANYRNDEDFWYAGKYFSRKKEIRSGESGSGQQRRSESGTGDESTDVNRTRSRGTGAGTIQAMLWLIIIVGFIIFLIIYVGAFRKKNSFIDNKDEMEEETEDIFAINYQRDIDKAAQAGNYRLAIRLMFLRLLKNLAEKNIIQYKTDRTNLDYLMQLSSTRYYQDFFRITRNYEYSWYGKFPVSADSYSRIKTDIENFDPTNRG